MLVWAVLTAAVLLGGAARFYRLGEWPPGLYHDEAYNGQDALRVVAGERPLFFPANNGREPLFLYGVALAVAVWGRTPFAVRVTAAVLGTLTIPATFFMGRALFGSRVGLWSAVLIAVAPWPINLSRIGLRAISLPLVSALALGLWWQGRRAQGPARTAWFLGGGALVGLSMYTYTAARFVVAVLVLFALFQTWVNHERLIRSEWLYLALAAVLAMAPLVAYGLQHWDTFVARPAQVSILNPAISQGRPLRLLAGNIVRAAGLFTFQGDDIPRHNVPLRPLFDPVVSVFMVLGVFFCLRDIRRELAGALTLIWTAVMLLPTILAEDCPHFLRAVGVLPVAVLLPGLGLERARGWLDRRWAGWAGGLLVGGVLLTSAVWGGSDYLQHLGSPELGYAFEADQVQEAIAINQFLGSGWQGQGIAEPAGGPIEGRQVYLAPRMWENRQTVNFLVGSPERVSILGRDPVVPAQEVLVLAWPHEDMSRVRQVFPNPAEITVWSGPLERGDLDAKPSLLYVAFRGTPGPDPALPALARFEEGIELLDWQIEAGEAGETRLTLRWRAVYPPTMNYTVFVHLERDGVVIAQDDRTPGADYYPTTWWRPGDQIVDTHFLPVSYHPDQDRLWVGWYELDSMQHLQVLDGHTQSGITRFLLE